MVIELRSDTFTLPTREMMDAITAADLGDDGYGEDGSVRELERYAADALGKDSSCLMASGTMANLASVLAHSPRGSQVLLGDQSDLYIYEHPGASLLGGLSYCPLPTQKDGRILLQDIVNACEKAEHGGPEERASLLCLENPHNLCGGRVLPVDYLEQVARCAETLGIPIHLDGARIFNAATALGVSAREIARFADSVQVCLSKGLAAPVGSVVAGSVDFVSRARSWRKLLGGGMRQAGIIAAPGIVALRRMTERLVDDHANARRLADGLSSFSGIDLDVEAVQTNLVVFRVIDPRFTAKTFLARAWSYGIHLGDFKYGRIRGVLHHGVTRSDVDYVLETVQRILTEGPAGPSVTPVRET